MYKNTAQFEEKSKIKIDKYCHLFDTEHIKHDLRGKSIRGGFSTITGQGITFILHMVSTIILARLLLPEQFGLISMVLALTGFAKMFKDLGLSDATIQYEKITHEQVSTLFWINLSFGIAIMFIVAALSPVIAWFYGEPRLVWISIVLSCSFFFSGLTIQHQALLHRQMRFFQLALVAILSTTFSSAIGIIMAIHGFEYWALVWKNIAEVAFIAIGTWIICNWLPGLPKLGSGIRSMLHFGKDITGFRMIEYFSFNLDHVLIGRFKGPGPLGLYNKAYQLMSMPVNQLRCPLTSVGLPALSSLQNHPDKYRLYYKKFISVLSFISMPIMMYMGIFSRSVILLLLGEKWIEAADIFRILAIAGFIQPVADTCGLVMISCRQTKRYFYWGLMKALCMVTAFSIGIHWGALGVAAAYAIAHYVTLIPSLWYCFRDTPISISLFFQAILLPTLSSLIMGLILILISQKISLSINILEIVFSLFVAIILYCGIYWFIPGGKQRLIEYSSYPLAVLKR